MPLAQPILQYDPFSNNDLPQNKLLHTNKGLFRILLFKKLVKAKSFALRTQATKESGFLSKRQHYFASIAWLKALMFRNPSASSDFGLHIYSKTSNANSFFFLMTFPTKKSFAIFSMSLHKPIRSLKMLIGYIEIAWMTTLIRTFSPPALSCAHRG